jgi:hypothetical protein
MVAVKSMARAFASLAVAIAGCTDVPWRTALMVVLEGDLAVPGDVDGLSVQAAAGPDAPGPGSAGIKSVFYSFVLGDFPTAVHFYPTDMTANFSVTLQLQQGLTGLTGLPPTIVLSRTVRDIRFSQQHTMMMALPMLRACACDGTSCPPVGTPGCDDIAQPALEHYDPAVATPMQPAVPVSQPSFIGRH